MNKLLACLLALFLCLPLPVKAEPRIGKFVAVICSPDVRFYFDRDPKYRTDYIVSLNSWDELDKNLEAIKTQANGQPIYLDFLCHGNTTGLYVRPNYFFMRTDRSIYGICS